MADAALFATGVRPPTTTSEDPSSSSTTTTTDTLTLSTQNSTDSQAQELAHVHGGAPLNLSSLISTTTNPNGTTGSKSTNLGGNKKERNAEELRAHKAAFFFKLERELEKVSEERECTRDDRLERGSYQVESWSDFTSVKSIFDAPILAISQFMSFMRL